MQNDNDKTKKRFTVFAFRNENFTHFDHIEFTFGAHAVSHSPLSNYLLSSRILIFKTKDK